MSRIYTAADQLIGHTPLLELTHLKQELRSEGQNRWPSWNISIPPAA